MQPASPQLPSEDGVVGEGEHFSVSLSNGGGSS